MRSGRCRCKAEFEEHVYITSAGAFRSAQVNGREEPPTPPPATQLGRAVRVTHQKNPLTFFQ